MKILITLLTLVALITSVNAGQKEASEDIKKQCQYIVYGNGKDNVYTGLYMLGVVSGIASMIEEKHWSVYAKRSSKIEIRHKACQSALTNTMKLAFEGVYHIEVMNVMIK